MALFIFLLSLIPLNCSAETLLTQQNHTFDWSRLQGRPVIANVGFSSCKTSCPLLNSKMKDLVTEFKGQIYAVTVSVDPDYDSPSVLAKYVHDRKYDIDGWYFVTGNKMDVFTFIKDRLRMTGVGQPFAHSNDIVVFSKKGEYVMSGAAFSEDKILKNKIRELLK